MHLDLLPRQSSSDCLSCNEPPPPCNCSANESCVQTARLCNSCPVNQCVAAPNSSSGSGSGGVSTGALAGAVVAALVVVGGAIAFYIWYRRRSRARKAAAAKREAELTAPASAEAVLNRPDPTEKPSRPPTELSTVRVYSSSSSSDPVINLDPESRGHSASGTAPLDSAARRSQCNPFEDDHSIQTTSTGTQSTNVIPIAFVPPGSVGSRSTSAASGPIRPNRAPDLTLNYDHVNVSADSMRGNSPAYPRSTISGISGVSSRNSYMSGASYSSDFFNEAPMIVTQNQGAVRQVLGVVKAEMIHTSGSSSGSSPSSPMSMDSLKPPSVASRPSIRSPLAATSFGPADVVTETEEEHMQSMEGDPFADEQPSSGVGRISPSPSAATFGNIGGGETDWVAEGPARPWANKDDSSRPSSISTQAGSIVDIGSATRVNVGLLSGQSSLKSPYRTTMGRLVSPTSTLEPQTLEEQQQRALAHAQAQARAQGFDKAQKRISGSSAISAASTRADSILESFPFVPPSPISSRPIRSPPRSPLHQQFSNTQSSSKETPETTPEPPKSPAASDTARPPPPPSPLDPPNRRLLGLSTVSQSSTTSSGLGSFPFQIDSGNTESSSSSSAPPSAFPPSAYQGRQRASLDTLALMSDLSTYPLGFDRDPRDSFTEFAKSAAYISPSDRPL